MQLQMFVTETDFCDFFVWTNCKNEANKYILIRVKKDDEFCNRLKTKFEKVFYKVLLPELITRKRDPSNDKYQRLYCYCNRPYFKPMIACDNNKCKLEWYHYSCVNLTRTPEENKKWFCPDCKKKR